MEKLNITGTKGNIAIAIQGKGSKLIIICPGKLDSKDYPHLIDLADRFSQIGYTAVRMDPTGTWESDGSDADFTTTQYLQDVRSIIDHMLNKRAYDQIIVSGHSMGGYISLLASTMDQRITGAIAIMSPYALNRPGSAEKLEEWEKTGFRLSKRDIPNSNEFRFYKLPYAHAKDRLQYNILERKAGIKIPVLLVAGEIDDKVKAFEVKKLYDELDTRKEYLEIEGVGHNYREKEEEIQKVNSQIITAASSLFN